MKHSFHIRYFKTLPSTNDYAKANIRELGEGDVIFSEQQTKGRGRFDRIWISEKDLTFTMISHGVMRHHLIAPCSLVAAFKKFHIDAFIKWPNDILVDHKKVCGILIEKVYEGNDILGEVIGIGVNLSRVPLALQDKAAFVDVDRNILLEEILYQYEILAKLSNEEILALYRKANYLQGRKFLLNDVLWSVEDINEEGYLMVKNSETLRALKSEEVSLSHIY